MPGPSVAAPPPLPGKEGTIKFILSVETAKETVEEAWRSSFQRMGFLLVIVAFCASSIPTTVGGVVEHDA